MEELESRVSSLEDELATYRKELQYFITETQNTLSGYDRILTAVEPWVGPEGQLRVRLERSEQAILALVEDPSNPHSSADRARMILTTIPTPPA